MRSLAEESEAELGGRLSVLQRQKQDHVVLDRLLEELRSSSGSDQDEVLRRVPRSAIKAAFAEEPVLWPAIRRALPDGQELTSRVEEEHQEINAAVARLEPTDPDVAEHLAREQEDQR